MSDREALDRAFQQITVVCLGLFIGVVMFAAVASFLIMSGAFEGYSEMAGLRWALGGPAALLLLAAPILEARLGHLPAQADRNTVMQRFQTAKIVGFALREGAGLLGAMAGLLTGSVAWAAGLGGAAALTMVLAWPRKEALMRRLSRVPPE